MAKLNIFKPDKEDELLPHIQAWQEGPSPEMNTQLIKTLDPIIRTGIQNFGGGENSPNLYNRAKAIVIEAAPKYDPSQGRVRDYFMSHLRGLRRQTAQLNQVIRKPEVDAMHQQRLNEIENALREEHGREPTEGEVARSLGVSSKKLKKIRELSTPVAEGTLQRNDIFNVASTLPGHVPGYDAWIDFIYHDLSPTDQLIVDYGLGRKTGQPMSVAAIAKKLGISPSAVSQRTTKIQATLDEFQPGRLA